MTYNLKDSNGRMQRIHARTLAQAHYALAEINRDNATRPDKGAALARSWREGARKVQP